MLRQVLMFICLLKLTNSWVIEAQPNTVTSQLTPNVTIECHHGFNDINSPKITEMYRIRVMKFDNKDKWDTVAELIDTDSVIKTSFAGAVVTGMLDKPTNSYIKIHFNIASDEAIGQFMCEVDEIDASIKMHVINTKPIVIKEQGIAYPEVLKILLDLKIQEQGDHLNLQRWMVEMSNAINNITYRVESEAVEQREREHLMAVALANLTERVERINIDFTQQINQINLNVKTVTDNQNNIKEIIDFLHNINNPAETWPAGHITLLKPESGCPGSPTSTWQTNAMRWELEGGTYGYTKSKSDELNLYGDVFKYFDDKHQVHQELCTKVSGDHGPMMNLYNGPQWPKGSYCYMIFAHDNEDLVCPISFRLGWTYYGNYNDDEHVLIINTSHDHTEGPTYMHWCCRDDGNVSTPIVLPIHTPFYLISYKYFEPRCQQVLGMDVSSQEITANAKDSDSGSHGIGLNLCYYTPSK